MNSHKYRTVLIFVISVYIRNKTYIFQNSPSVFPVSSFFSNSVITEINSPKFSILVLLSVVSSITSAGIYPVSFNILPVRSSIVTVSLSLISDCIISEKLSNFYSRFKFRVIVRVRNNIIKTCFLSRAIFRFSSVALPIFLFRLIDNSCQTYIIIRIIYNSQICNYILNFLTIIESEVPKGLCTEQTHA